MIFDRQDIKKLLDFIRKTHQGIDLLVMAELTRFSREAGDAINLVKKIKQITMFPLLAQDGKRSMTPPLIIVKVSKGNGRYLE